MHKKILSLARLVHTNAAYPLLHTSGQVYSHFTAMLQEAPDKQYKDKKFIDAVCHVVLTITDLEDISLEYCIAKNFRGINFQ